jgi:hypothetical protein
MFKTLVICLLIAMVALTLPGCSVITGESVGGPAAEEIPVNTEFGRMLGDVPYTFFEEHDLWFGNMLRAKELYGLEDLNSYEEAEETIKNMPGDRGRQFVNDWASASGMYTSWNRPEIAPIVGFDAFAFDRVLVINSVPPRISCIAEGNIDEAFIISKLAGLGYSRTDYGQYSYYGIRGDFQIDIKDPLSRLVLAAMNRVAVFDDTVIFSPATADVTGIFDAMDGDTPSVIDNAVCRALADSLGDVLAATITTPERIVYSDLYTQENVPKFDFAIPADWGTLRGYEMAALGYRAEGDARYFDIALYYEDKTTAEADGKEIVKRMQTYKMGTYMGGQIKPDDSFMFTEWWQPGEPVVKEYGEGVVLKISCKSISEIPRWISSFIGNEGMPFRDVLSLVPDPAPYIGKNEGPEVIIREK